MQLRFGRPDMRLREHHADNLRYTSGMPEPPKRRKTDVAEPLLLSDETKERLRATPPFWSIIERRAILRELIAHEDKLTTDRIQALYTLQGLLFTTFGLLTRAELPGPTLTRIIITLIALVGITSARFYWQELHNNETAIDQILCDWHELGQLFPALTYPRLIGYIAKEKQRAATWLPRRAVPALLMCVWFVIAAFVWARHFGFMA